MPTPRARHPARQRGFTLIEVLVSLLILAVLAATAWKGMDGISTARQVADGNLKQTLRLQSVMTQMEADLGQVIDTVIVNGLQFDGAHLRLTRRTAEGVQVVVWYVQRGRLLRWSSPVTYKVGELQKYWMSSYQLRGKEPGTLTALKGVEQWQVYCFRSGNMSNCQSTGNVFSQTAAAQGAASGATGGQSGLSGLLREQLPNALRSQLTLGEGSGFGGTLTRDMMLAPQPTQN
ncbi:MAG TPA: prepilin-type N-terminal cleavage/methylation domain-containing protein [Aquabacterium sp.]|uniref:PulJ/GspJ family protein n=1 Tax=Aquabacterium sp. TaxID=1872578 RepID=UPI002E329FC4|nr:prepilin-type N-terminal cleavage/methylation domain-containing protein [Aquabacterium sp.]HEX5354975.1 prepilin-type N-terminal cleavage/methylation domain-containing protein [Aquabacterium sp.]